MRRIAAAAAATICSAVLVACGQDSTKPVEPPPQGPFGNVLAWSAAGPERVFAMTDVDGCATCATLWRWQVDQPNWQRVHDFGEAEAPFTDESYELPPINPWGLAMAPDGRHGLVSWDAEGLLQTADGGRTWKPLEIPDLDREVADGTPVVVGDHAVVLVGEPCESDECSAGDLWRSRLGAAAWEPVAKPRGYFYDLDATGGTLAVVSTTRRGDLLSTSTDTGASWTGVPAPRNTARGSIGTCAPRGQGARSVVVECLTDDGTSLRVTADGGRTWRELLRLGTWQHSPEYADSVLVIGDDRFLVSTPKQSLLIDGTGRELAASGVPRSVRTGACTDRRTCVVASDGGRLWRTEDAGRTWRVLAEGKKGTR